MNAKERIRLAKANGKQVSMVSNLWRTAPRHYRHRNRLHRVNMNVFPCAWHDVTVEEMLEINRLKSIRASMSKIRWRMAE